MFINKFVCRFCECDKVKSKILDTNHEEIQIAHLSSDMKNISAIWFYLRQPNQTFYSMSKEKFFGMMGWVGMATSVMMYIFYFPQIQNNLAGHKGTFIQPFMAGINCTLWVAYGLFKEKRDLPLAIANTPGIIFGFVAAFTAL